MMLTKAFYIYDPNLVILAWRADEIWRGQARVWHIYTPTHINIQTQRRQRQYPKAKTGLE